VRVTWPLKVATIWPFGLRKFEPVTSMPCPATPLEGRRAEITGGPAAAGATVVVVVLVVVVLDPAPDPDCGPAVAGGG